MKIALFATNFGPCAAPDDLVRVAHAAEEAGMESLWTGEHVVLPDPQVPPSPMAPEVPILDPVVALTFMAAHTTRIRLGTGIIILPQRNPLVLAKELASLDVLSKGRLVFGIGVGYLKPEFDALNVPFDHKGARSEEFLQAMLAIWTMEKPEFRGRFFSFGGVRAEPRPVQRPHPEIVFGGHTPDAFRRAARLARGWYGFALDPERTKACLDGLRAACRDVGRRFEELEISVTPAPERERPILDREAARRFADLGVHRLIVFSPRARDAEGVLRVVGAAERELVGQV
ncbi:MAG TPA: LLM class F420-dependent oxidoreductase [Candidatus Binatus sp.]|nr:LLM class F420-dependent oxidoreductase [Candidatus Binatus sp.]